MHKGYLNQKGHAGLTGLKGEPGMPGRHGEQGFPGLPVRLYIYIGYIYLRFRAEKIQ